jgi:hypothetical protein
MNVKGTNDEAGGYPMITIRLHHNDKDYKAVIDTGGPNNFISEKLVKELKLKPGETQYRYRHSLTGEVEKPTYMVRLRFGIENDIAAFDRTLLFVEMNLSDKYDVLLGVPFLGSCKKFIFYGANAGWELEF